MANELTGSFSVLHTKDPKVSFRPSGSVQATQAGTGVFQSTLAIGTTAEDVSFGDVAPGLVILWNLSDANFVDFGMSDGGTIKSLGRLYPTTRWPSMFFLKPGTTLRMQADTGSCNVHVVAYTL